jgi:hypothetical protein
VGLKKRGSDGHASWAEGVGWGGGGGGRGEGGGGTYRVGEICL